VNTRLILLEVHVSYST